MFVWRDSFLSVVEAVSDGNAETLDEAETKARSLLEQEKKDIEHSVSAIILQVCG